MNMHYRVGFLSALVVLLLASRYAAAQTPSEPSPAAQRLEEIENELEKASLLFQRQDYAAAAAIIQELDTSLAKISLGRNRQLRRQLKRLTGNVEQAKRMLADQGVEIGGKKEADGKDDAPVVAEGKPSTTSFTRDIAPIFVEHCLGCHGLERPRARLTLANFEGIKQGGQNGPLMESGSGKSLLIQKLRGKADGERMPLDEDPLNDETIKKIEDWLATGASFDGSDASLELSMLIAEQQAAGLDAGQLWQQRSESAIKQWQLGLPQVPHQQIETKNLRMLGDESDTSLEELAEQIEGHLAKAAELFGLPADKPLIRGGVSIFVLRRPYDYREFTQMVERRQLEDDSLGHFFYDKRDPYVVVTEPPAADSYAVDIFAAELLTGLVTADQGNVPKWFAVGTGRALAAELAPKDARVRQWSGQARAVLRSGFQPAGFLEDRLPPTPTALVSYVLVNRLMSARQRYRQLIEAVQQGQPFNAAFQQTYRVTLERALASLRSGGAPK